MSQVIIVIYIYLEISYNSMAFVYRNQKSIKESTSPGPGIV